MNRPIPIVAATLLPFLSLVSGVFASSPAEWANENVDDLVPLYEHFHRNPELSLQEQRTARRLAEELEAAGVPVRTGIGGHGLVGILQNGDGKLLMLRTDLDALPVTEETNVAYASKVRVRNPTGSGEVGVMHACGHDIHMTNLVGVARYLSANRNQWRGTVMFIGQPAEERVLGAKAMLDDGLYERFGKPDYAIALHVSTEIPSGTVGYRGGFALANVDSVDITVHGVSGHGAAPETTIDPIVQAAQLVLALQTIVSREIKPIEPAVVTIGSIHGGAKHNIISDQCHLQLTLRSYSTEVREQILRAIKRKAKGVAIAAGAPEPTIKVSEGTDAVFNDVDLVESVVPALQKSLGEENVLPQPPTMGAEDFGLFTRGGVPVFMFRLGSISEERMQQLKRPLSLHSSLYYPDVRPTLVAGITAMAAAALELLPQDQ